jgi:hypothetical protein
MLLFTRTGFLLVYFQFTLTGFLISVLFSKTSENWSIFWYSELVSNDMDVSEHDRHYTLTEMKGKEQCFYSACHSHR